MKFSDSIIHILQESGRVNSESVIDSSFVNSLEKASQLLVDTFKSNGKVLLAGNGGSAADSQHIAAEFIGRLNFDRDPLPAIALTANTSNLTCIANDYGYENCFRRELSSLGNEGDILIAMSISGKSRNILRCIELASSMNIESFFLTGDISFQNIRNCIHIPLASKETDLVQETHFTILHELCKYIDQKFSNEL